MGPDSRRASRCRRATSSSSSSRAMPSDSGGGERTDLAGGKVILDYPAPAVARLTISNPERRNALDHDVLGALAEVMPQLDRGIEIRCVLITGAGEIFSAGYDIGGEPRESVSALWRGV